MYLDLALIVLARSLVRDWSHSGFPNEWSRPPLASILPYLIPVLNYHPAKLGEILQKAYDNTFPEKETGNANQLDALYKELFGFSKQNYLDEYEVRYRAMSGDINREYDSQIIPTPLLKDLAKAIIHAYRVLSAKSESEHRSLRNLVDYLHFVFQLSEVTSAIGSDLVEFHDYWIKMSHDERKTYADKFLSEHELDI